jgi:hypothetical protein
LETVRLLRLDHTISSHNPTTPLTLSPLLPHTHRRRLANVFKDLMHQLPRRRRTLHILITSHLLRNPIRFLRIDDSVWVGL